MFGVGVGIRVGGFTPISGGGGFDPDAQAFFDRVTTAGGTLTTTEKNATNQLVLDMKSAGIWSSMKAIYPMVGASAAACAQNLKSASFTGTFSSGWTFASTGVTPNGTSAYMNTGLVPSGNLSQNSSHISSYVRTAPVGSLIGTDKDFRLWIGPNFNGTQKFCEINTSGVTPTSASNSIGFWLGSRISNIESKLYLNSSIDYTNTSVSTGLDTLNIVLAARNRSGAPQNFSSSQNAFASIGDGLTDTQASNFYTAVQTFQTTLARQV